METVCFAPRKYGFARILGKLHGTSSPINPEGQTHSVLVVNTQTQPVNPSSNGRCLSNQTQGMSNYNRNVWIICKSFCTSYIISFILVQKYQCLWRKAPTSPQFSPNLACEFHLLLIKHWLLMLNKPSHPTSWLPYPNFGSPLPYVVLGVQMCLVPPLEAEEVYKLILYPFKWDGLNPLKAPCCIIWVCVKIAYSKMHFLIIKFPTGKMAIWRLHRYPHVLSYLVRW